MLTVPGLRLTFTTIITICHYRHSVRKLRTAEDRKLSWPTL